MPIRPLRIARTSKAITLKYNKPNVNNISWVRKTIKRFDNVLFKNGVNWNVEKTFLNNIYFVYPFKSIKLRELNMTE